MAEVIKAGSEIVNELAERDGWAVAFSSKNYVKFKVTTSPGKIWLSDLPEFDNWDCEQYESGAKEITVSYFTSEYKRVTS